MVAAEEDMPESDAGRRLKTLVVGLVEPKQLLVIPGAGHGRFVEADPERYPSELLRFFDSALRDERR